MATRKTPASDRDRQDPASPPQDQRVVGPARDRPAGGNGTATGGHERPDPRRLSAPRDDAAFQQAV